MWKAIGSSLNSEHKVVAAPPKRKSSNVPPRHSRNARACTGCKKVKSKCEELHGVEGTGCRRCQRLNLECVFTDAPAHRRNPTGGAVTPPLATAPGTRRTSELLGASKKRRGDDELGGETSSLVTTAASPAVLMKDWNVSEFLNNETNPFNHSLEPKLLPRSRQVISNGGKDADSESKSPPGGGQDSDLALAMESRCNIAAGGACEVGRAKPIQAASLPPAVAAFIAFEEARSDLPKPVIFMRNSFNSDIYFMVNQSFQDRVSSAANFTPPMPGQCPGLLNGPFAVEDMESMFAYVDSSSKGLIAPPPSGGNIERSVKLEVPNPVRIRVRPPGMAPPGAAEPLCPFVPCHVAVQVVVAIGPGLQAVHVAFVARPVYEVDESQQSSWFPAWAMAPVAVLDSAAVAVSALMGNFSPISAPVPTPVPQSVASSVEPRAPGEPGGSRDERKLSEQAPRDKEHPDLLPGHHEQLYTQPGEQQLDDGFNFDDVCCDNVADANESLIDGGFDSLLDGASVLANLEDSATEDLAGEACA